MRNEEDKTIKTSYTYRISHIKKLKKISEETFIPISALIRKALIKFFEEYEKSKKHA